MIKRARTASLLLILFSILLAGFIFLSEREENFLSQYKFKFGLDLSGGTQLIYDADVSELPSSEVEGSMAALRDVIERRVNAFGVSEPRVQVERGGVTGDEHRLIVELPGVTDIDEAVEQIGETPTLEFKLQKTEEEIQQSIQEIDIPEENISEDGTVDLSGLELTPSDLYKPTGLTGRYVESANLRFSQMTGEPVVIINFNSEGADLFREITGEHTGEILAIFLDGVPISTPVIQEEIPTGEAVISGQFTPETARELARNLSYGALPIPIDLVATSSVGPTLGAQVLEEGVSAGIVGLVLVALFMMAWYRVPGVVAVIALTIYTLVNLALYKLIPVTLTAAGIAGFILSIGMAVDANVLIFERMNEEIRRGKKLSEAIRVGFDRAWPSVMDGNLTVFITGVILFWFGTSLIQGFAITLMIGTAVSVATAGIVSRMFLLSVLSTDETKNETALFKSGFRGAMKKVKQLRKA